MNDDSPIQIKDEDVKKHSTNHIGDEVTRNIGESQFSKYGTGKNGSTGHGFAAEDANTLADKLSGKKAQTIGKDNALNGADRCVDGKTFYQTKYCKTPRETVNAAFDKSSGLYRYKLRNGKPMKLEVPRDQYEQCIEIMRQKILDGKVPGVKNPDHASKMVKRGVVTHEQAVRLAQSGKIESLIYDVANGAIVCTTAAGISAVITFTAAKLRGEKTSDAVKMAAKDGGITGGVTMAANVISSQCAKSLARKAAEEGTKKAASKIGTSVLKAGAKANVVTGVITTAVVSRHDIKKAYRGEISVSECATNVGVNAGSVAAGMACAAKGAAICTPLGPVGMFVGGLAGGIVGGIAGEQGLRFAVNKFKFGKKKNKRK